MKIQLLSDLHIEFWPKLHNLSLFQTDADVCVLAGDINVGRENTLKTLKEFASMYSHVIYIRGNHEEYGSSFNAFRDKDAFKDKLPANVHFLDPGTLHLEGVTFIGAPLWTDFGNDPLAEHMSAYGINDFVRVKDATTQRYTKECSSQKAFIKQAYDAYAGKKVIITHFLPAMECISPRFLSGGPINKYFANNMGNYISTLSDTTWMFGHTHDSIDFHIGDTRMLCNPYGYHGREINPNFNKKAVYEIK
jgi:hypothetical protein